MTIELTPEMEAIVTERLNTGGYASASAVIEEALHAVQSHRLQQFLPLSQKEIDEKARRIEVLFARIDADGPFEDFEIDRHSSPSDQREPWLR